MPASLVRTSTIGYALLFSASLVIIGWQGRLSELWLPSSWEATSLHLLLGVGLASGVLALGELARRFWGWARRLDDEFRRLLAPLDTKRAFVLALASGLAEEAFFRATVQPTLGLWATSLAFGLLHYPLNRHMVPWTVIAVGMGFAFGIVFESTGSLMAVALAHGLINFVELRRIGRSPSV